MFFMFPIDYVNESNLNCEIFKHDCFENLFELLSLPLSYFLCSHRFLKYF